MKFILHGNPTALQRPRFYCGNVVDSQKEQKFLDGLQIRKQWGCKAPMEKAPISFQATFFMPFPKSLPEKGRDRLRDQYHTKRKDLDNMIKYILDVCNNIVFTDDSLIAQISAKKIWADTGKTEFTLEYITEYEAP